MFLKITVHYPIKITSSLSCIKKKKTTTTKQQQQNQVLNSHKASCNENNVHVYLDYYRQCKNVIFKCFSLNFFRIFAKLCINQMTPMPVIFFFIKKQNICELIQEFSKKCTLTVFAITTSITTKSYLFSFLSFFFPHCYCSWLKITDQQNTFTNF